MEASTTKLIKKWLRLPRNVIQAIVYHPDVLKVPQSSTIKTKAKVSFLAAILQTLDPLLREFHVFLSYSKVQFHFGFTSIFSRFMDSAADIASSIKATKKKCFTGIANDIRKHWMTIFRLGMLRGSSATLSLWRRNMVHGGKLSVLGYPVVSFPFFRLFGYSPSST